MSERGGMGLPFVAPVVPGVLQEAGGASAAVWLPSFLLKGEGEWQMRVLT